MYAILSTLILMTAEVAAGSTPSTRANLGNEIAIQDEVQFSENIVGSVKTNKTHA